MSRIKSIAFSLPIDIKMFLCRTLSILDRHKQHAVDKVDISSSKDFPNLNSNEFKRSLKKFFNSSFRKAEGIDKWVDHLYNDEITMLHKGRQDNSHPFIICVVKNEGEKLLNFFKHYKELGEFNYVFIDNGSTDETVDIIINNGGTVYQCLQPFETQRKLTWINKVYSTFPVGSWTILLDADELLIYEGYETVSINEVLSALDKHGIDLCGAAMIDMFPKHPCEKGDYMNNYCLFQNSFHEEKSFFCKSLYGGIREREFKFGDERIFLIKKHPIIKKTSDTLLIHCHYIFPFERNFSSTIYFGLLHYKLFDKEIEKYKKIAEQGGYGNGSIEYKTYLNAFSKKSFEDIFKPDDMTLEFSGTHSIEEIQCISNIRSLLK